MPRANPRRTKSAPKRRLYIIIGVVLLLTLVAVTVFVFHAHKSSGQSSATLTIAKGTPAAKSYHLETVTTEADQARGLSGRSGLDRYTGMLFTYEQPNQRCMWMKDMKFNIDIIWVDASNRVTSIVPNLSPSTYPQTYCATANRVIELGAGEARASGLRVGQIVDLR